MALLVFEVKVRFLFLFTVLVDHYEVNYFDLCSAQISHQMHENPTICLIHAEIHFLRQLICSNYTKQVCEIGEENLKRKNSPDSFTDKERACPK